MYEYDMCSLHPGHNQRPSSSICCAIKLKKAGPLLFYASKQFGSFHGWPDGPGGLFGADMDPVYIYTCGSGIQGQQPIT